MARDLARLLERKDDAHYGVAYVAIPDATRMVGWADRLITAAHDAIAA